jgi:DnaJ-class molecular chaperone
MKVVDGKLVLETKNCSNCDNGTVPSKISCKKCNGSGNGPKGGKGRCRSCYGSGSVWDHDNREKCKKCNGIFENAEKETMCDYIPEFIWESLPIRVEKINKKTTWNEQNLGLGFIFCCVDYGRAYHDNDEKVIADVKKHKGVQASKIVDDNYNFAKEIVVTVKLDGYQVNPRF